MSTSDVIIGLAQSFSFLIGFISGFCLWLYTYSRITR